MKTKTLILVFLVFVACKTTTVDFPEIKKAEHTINAIVVTEEEDDDDNGGNDCDKLPEIQYFEAVPNPVYSGEPFTIQWCVKCSTKTEVNTWNTWQEVGHCEAWNNCTRDVSEDTIYTFYIRAANKNGQISHSFQLVVLANE